MRRLHADVLVADISVADISVADIAPGHALWPTFVATLASANLPTEDLRITGQRFFSIDLGAAYGGIDLGAAYGGIDLGAAYGGYVLDDRVALLRSLVVAPERRRTGIGSAALGMLLDKIRAAGGVEVWLLTTLTRDFFTHCGFHPVDRSMAPRVVTESAQFSTLCPSSAVLMCKTLI